MKWTDWFNLACFSLCAVLIGYGLFIVFRDISSMFLLMH